MEHLILFHVGTKNKPQRKPDWLKRAEFEPIVSCCHKHICNCQLWQVFLQALNLKQNTRCLEKLQKTKCTLSASHLIAGFWASLCVVTCEKSWSKALFKWKWKTRKLLLAAKGSKWWKLVIGSISYYIFSFFFLGKILPYRYRNSHYIYFFSTCMFKSYLAPQDARQMWCFCDADPVWRSGYFIQSFDHLTSYFCLATFFSTGKISSNFLY